jgi:3-hydroxyisobutyrate dehydrogenase-like beta-hydroxyacid dehydrogenase
MAKLAFLGLGLMGTPMATRLLEAGHDVTVWNRTAARTVPLVDRGAWAADTRPRRWPAPTSCSPC